MSQRDEVRSAAIRCGLLALGVLALSRFDIAADPPDPEGRSKVDSTARHHVYTLWASMKDEASPWMIAAEDEFAWEGNPERCEASFKAAREMAESNDFDVREVTLLVSYETVAAAFEPTKTEAEVETSG